MPLARSVATCGCWERTTLPSRMNVAMAAALRNSRGNRNESSPNPDTSSCSAALDGCSARVWMLEASRVSASAVSSDPSAAVSALDANRTRVWVTD